MSEDFAVLAQDAPAPTRASLEAPAGQLVFPFVGRDGPTFRHPDPIEPSDVVVRWRTTEGALVSESETRVLLPPALAPGQRVLTTVTTEVPNEPRSYEVELLRAEEPERVLARRSVTVRR